MHLGWGRLRPEVETGRIFRERAFVERNLTSSHTHWPPLDGVHAASWVGRTLPNGLRIIEPVGATTEGPLFRAEHPGGQEVALLIQRRASGESGIAARHPLFQQAARIRHRNVAAVLEIGEIPNGPPYVVLEVLTGEPLSWILTHFGPRPLDEAIELFLQAAAGVEAVHKVGLVHANLSPESLLVTATDEGPLVKLIRFAPVSLSLADTKPAGDDRSTAYTSPEHLAGRVPDERGDVYGLGAILHYMLVGFPPEAGSGSSIPEVLRAAITKATLPEPERRFRTVAAFVRAVRRAIEKDAAASRPRSRRPLLFVVAGVIAAIAAGLWLGAIEPGPQAQESEPDQGTEPAVPGPGTMVAADTAAGTEAATAFQIEPAAPLEPPAAIHEQVTLPPAAPPAEDSVDAYRAMGSVDTGVTGEMDTIAIELPPPPTFLAPQDRARVHHRIGLDEARELLGGPPHAIEGMSPLLMGLAGDAFPDGADRSRPLVRGVYLDPNGALILLDQQRIEEGTDTSADSGATIRWAIGDVMLFLHGESGTAVLRNIAKRVR